MSILTPVFKLLLKFFKKEINMDFTALTAAVQAAVDKLAAATAALAEAAADKATIDTLNAQIAQDASDKVAAQAQIDALTAQLTAAETPVA